MAPSGNHPEVSIVTVVMNRQAHLLVAAPEVSRWSGHGEHLIVDWSSEQAIERGDLPPDPRIRLVRVEGETSWQLTRAYNFAVTMACHEVILKLDADCWIDHRHGQPMRLNPHTYRRSGSAGGQNGIFMIRRQDFFSVGGFNEYLCGYGHDDKDLYQRLDKKFRCEYFPSHYFVTIEHGDLERVAAAEVGTSQTSGQLHPWKVLDSIARMEESKAVNRWLAEKLAWSEEMGRTSYIQEVQDRWVAKQGSIPQPPGSSKAQIRAIGNRVYLSNLLGLPERFLEGKIPHHDLETIRTWQPFLWTYANLRTSSLISLLKIAVRIGRGYRRISRRWSRTSRG